MSFQSFYERVAAQADAEARRRSGTFATPIAQGYNSSTYYPGLEYMNSRRTVRPGGTYGHLGSYNTLSQDLARGRTGSFRFGGNAPFNYAAAFGRNDQIRPSGYTGIGPYANQGSGEVPTAHQNSMGLGNYQRFTPFSGFNPYQRPVPYGFRPQMNFYGAQSGAPTGMPYSMRAGQGFGGAGNPYSAGHRAEWQNAPSQQLAARTLPSGVAMRTTRPAITF